MVKIFETMDLDQNGKIYWNEFIAGLFSDDLVLRDENLKEIFLFFDKDKKGYFDIDDFIRVVSGDI